MEDVAHQLERQVEIASRLPNPFSRPLSFRTPKCALLVFLNLGYALAVPAAEAAMLNVDAAACLAPPPLLILTSKRTTQLALSLLDNYS